MPITVTPALPFNGIPVNNTIANLFADSVAKLDFAGLFRGPGTIVKGAVRIDVQGPWTDGNHNRIGNNIQAQYGGGTVAAIRIADTLGAAVGAVNQLAVVQQAQAALTASFQTSTWQNVTGTSP